MQKLIFATNNRNKVDEIRVALGQGFEIMSLEEASIDIDIAEPHESLEANAREKSSAIYKLSGLDCFGEDTGLEVEALNGEPGVKSARYADEQRSFEKNIEKLLRELNGKPNRNARFRTIISLIFRGDEYQFEGICEGTILQKPSGSGGFGYDPIFMPLGSTKSFGEMRLEEKNLFSHRRKAMDKMISFLKTNS
jgi:XTP/dITP diphosphohydrolase